MTIQHADRFVMADAILGNELGISYHKLRAAQAVGDPTEVAKSRALFNLCYARRASLRLADDTALQLVIDSIGPAVRAELMASHG